MLYDGEDVNHERCRWWLDYPIDKTSFLMTLIFGKDILLCNVLQYSMTTLVWKNAEIGVDPCGSNLVFNPATNLIVWRIPKFYS